MLLNIIVEYELDGELVADGTTRKIPRELKTAHTTRLGAACAPKGALGEDGCVKSSVMFSRDEKRDQCQGFEVSSVVAESFIALFCSGGASQGTAVMEDCSTSTAARSETTNDDSASL